MPKGISKPKEKPPKSRKKVPSSPCSTLDSWILRDKNRVFKTETKPPENEGKRTKSDNPERIAKKEAKPLEKNGQTTKPNNHRNVKGQTTKKKTKTSEKEDERKQNSRSLQRHPSGSFQKYGVILPTYEEALLHKQKLEEMKQAIADFDVSNDSISDFELDFEEPKPIEILDCKHLNDEQLEEELKLNHQYLYDIVHGIRKSERHDKFMNAMYKTGTKTDDLTHNTSMITFTFEQKRLLLKYLSKKFGDNTQYFFKVLLPELCTKIFMDTHNMTYSEAVSYLNSRPAKPIDST
ncbi:hypothetical protein PPYR_11853 [Photinus pyralis]|uniref:Uncharacterized protein n=1 Tax=Photinus pyralis TaxID=7054 RepID=A0A1Y1MFM1_PHOPY|nr:hypothetical protein PPYR_11853 [Photinus pyralis]